MRTVDLELNAGRSIVRSLVYQQWRMEIQYVNMRECCISHRSGMVSNVIQTAATRFDRVTSGIYTGPARFQLRHDYEV